MKNKLFIIALSTVFFTAESCKKYEEGPTLSLRSKTERVANTWVIGTAYNNGEDVTDKYNNYILQLLNNNYAKLVVQYNHTNIFFEAETEGTWSFLNDKKDLRLDFQDDDADRTYTILRLKEDELWLREAGGTEELRLIPKP